MAGGRKNLAARRRRECARRVVGCQSAELRPHWPGRRRAKDSSARSFACTCTEGSFGLRGSHRMAWSKSECSSGRWLNSRANAKLRTTRVRFWCYTIVARWAKRHPFSSTHWSHSQSHRTPNWYCGPRRYRKESNTGRVLQARTRTGCAGRPRTLQQRGFPPTTLSGCQPRPHADAPTRSARRRSGFRRRSPALSWQRQSETGGADRCGTPRSRDRRLE